MLATERSAGYDGFTGFVEPHLGAMWVLATRLAGLDARDDVVQEALFTAWRRFATYDPARGTPRTWLLVLVADKSRKHWRAARPTLELKDGSLPPDGASPWREGTTAVPDLDAHLDLTRAVSRLAPRQRIAVELYYVLGLPVAECADVMGCAVGTVSSTLSDARKALRATLEVSP